MSRVHNKTRTRETTAQRREAQFKSEAKGELRCSGQFHALFVFIRLSMYSHFLRRHTWGWKQFDFCAHKCRIIVLLTWVAVKSWLTICLSPPLTGSPLSQASRLSSQALQKWHAPTSFQWRLLLLFDCVCLRSSPNPCLEAIVSRTSFGGRPRSHAHSHLCLGGCITICVGDGR